MKRRWRTWVGVFVVVLVSAGYFFLTDLRIAGGWEELDEEYTVLPNKIWKISFTEKLDKKSINADNVYVTNDKGEKVNAIPTLSEDLRTLIIEPPLGGYELSHKNYILHIEKEVKSLHGRGMDSKKELAFIVQETLPVVGSKAKLDAYFTKIIKEQKEERKGGFFNHTVTEESRSDSSAETSSTASQDVSETNVQVQGVDESDIVKTNGSHIFQVVDDKVRIINVKNGEKMKLQSTISFVKNFIPSQLFLYEDKLLVIGHSYEEVNQSKRSMNSSETMIAPMHESTKAIVFDISEPKNPKEEREIVLEGYHVSSRMIDGRVYLVTNQHPQYWLLTENENVDLRPRYADSNLSEDSIFVDYDKIQYLPESKESNYIMIAAFDLSDSKQDANIISYLGSGNQLYMSKENLFLSVENWSDLQDNLFDTPNTTIYKFAIDEMDIQFHSSAEVNGTILNQFSMDEHEGYFRIVTTKGRVWDDNRPSSNHLFIFDENLKEISSVEDLARGERIYSARFIGDRIYMVTFKETDPLFVIDASDPQNPKVTGELKIPGFSNYLHPLDENHLIGFGHDTKVVPSKDGSEPFIWTDGVKISLFDITDISEPKEKFTEIIGGRGTYSPLNHDHKALLYNGDQNLFAFPIHVYQNIEGSENAQEFEFQGAYVYHVDIEDGFSLKTKITHSEVSSPYEEWENEIWRLVYIGDYLYALSPSKISSYSISDFKQIGELSLK